MNPETQAVGTFLAKADGVLAGLAVADEVWLAVCYIMIRMIMMLLLINKQVLAALSGTQLAIAQHVHPGIHGTPHGIICMEFASCCSWPKIKMVS